MHNDSSSRAQLPQIHEFHEIFQKLCSLLGKGNCIESIKLASQLAQVTINHLEMQPQFLTGYACRFGAKHSNFSTEALYSKTIVLVVIAKQNQLNSRSLLALVIGLLITQALSGLSEDQQQLFLPQLYPCIQKLQLEIAGDVLRLGKQIHSVPRMNRIGKARLSFWQYFVIWSNYLTFSYPKNQKTDWHNRLTQLFQCSPTWTHKYLKPLLKFPSLHPPGGDFVYKQKNYTCLSVSSHGLGFIDQNGELSYAPLTEIEKTPMATTLESWCETASINSEEGSPFPELFPVMRPPRSLFAVMKLLGQDEIDMITLEKAIAREPSFSEFVIATAVDGNRLNIPVKSIKQGIMTHGSYRLGDMLITYALLNRFNQSEFPLRHKISDFIGLYMALASQIAEQAKVMLPQTAALTALLLASPLFSYPSLKVKTKLACKQPVLYSLDITQMLPQDDEREFANSVLKLCAAWKLPPRHQQLLKGLLNASERVQKSKEYILLALAFTWARQMYGGSFRNAICKSENKLLPALALTPDHKTVIREAVTQHLVSHLQRR